MYLNTLKERDVSSLPIINMRFADCINLADKGQYRYY